MKPKWNNDTCKIFHCDNLRLLEILESDSVDLIYSDILFNTGKEFPDYVDRLGTPKDAIKWYEPRLVEMKRILKCTGNIYLHCDYNLSHYLKVFLDLLFGRSHFINEIVWWFNSAPTKTKRFSERHNIILRYSKTNDFYFNDSEIRVPYSTTAPRGFQKEKYYNAFGKVMDDVWKINMLGQNDKTERTGYSSQKPKELIYPIVTSSCPANGLVADFFMGSGTVAEVCKETGRKFIGCDVSEKAIKLSIERLS